MVITVEPAEPALQYVPMSYEDYLALPEQPRTEWVDGVVVVMATPLAPHQRAARRLIEALERDLPSLWIEGGLTVMLPRNRERVPDVLALPHRPGEEESDTTRGWQIHLCPVLVAEVLSPSTRREDLVRKAPEYAERGISQYWVVDPEARTIEVLANVDGAWEAHAVIDDEHPLVEVGVGDRGTVTVDLAAILDS